MFDSEICWGCVFRIRLIEMDEALETLDAAIEYKNESIQNRQENLRKSVLLSQVRKKRRRLF